MACHRRCPHLFVSGQMLSEKGRAFPKAPARPIHTHPLSHNHLLQRKLLPPSPSSPPAFPCTWRDVERNKNDANWKWLGKPWKHTIELPPPFQSLLAAGFAPQPADNGQDVHTGQRGLQATGEQKNPSCMKRSTVQQHAALAVIGEEQSGQLLWSGSLPLLFRLLA